MEAHIRNSKTPIPDPRYWGSKFWFTMHTIAFFYEDQPSPTEMAHAKDFYESLQSLLPCPGCAHHYSTLLQKYPVEKAITSRHSLMRWVNKIHNEVNRRLGKPVLTFDEYIFRMRHLEEPTYFQTEFLLFGVILALIVLGVTRFYYTKHHG